jgi:MFS family permease
MPPSRSALWPLFVLFGVIYFVQGLVEPTACLPAQPLQAQLRGGGYSADQIGQFFALLAIAWSLKPLFGLVSDFLPIRGRRRRPYLILSTLLAAGAFFAAAAVGQLPASEGPSWFAQLSGIGGELPDVSRLGVLLVAAGFGIAMTDVVTDALAVETGQPLGITGQIQSVQWLALSVAGLAVGSGGGYIAEHGYQRPMLAGCGALALLSLGAVLVLAREPRHAVLPRDEVRRIRRQLFSGRRLMALAAAAAFLFLWNFNPFSSNVLQGYMTGELGLSEQFYGHTRSLQSLGKVAACLVYFPLCRRVPFGLLIHTAIVAGIAASLGYLLLRGAATALAISFFWGLAWQIGLLIQLDLSARVCPTESAGTTFALLMAISNTGESCGLYVGGGWYDRLAGQLGSRHLAFDSLVLLAALFTAGCWLIVPLLRWTTDGINVQNGVSTAES